MNIGHFVSVVAGQKGFENNVSGHIQVPLHAMQLLQDAGHTNHLITNAFGVERSLPACLPEGVQVHLVVDARDRGGVLERTAGEGSGLKLFALLKQVSQIKKICKEHNFDVLHLYGYNRTALLAGGLRFMGLPIPVVVTMFATFFPERFAWFKKRLWNRVDAVITATDYTVAKLEEQNIQVTKVRHGVMRDLLAEQGAQPIEQQKRVLFWRDLTVENGADVALAVFDSLAGKYPAIQFEMTVRKHWNELCGVQEIVDRHTNVVLRRFPYEEGVALSQLLLESVCVVLPIRDMSIDPQLVIVETLAAGIPIVTTNQRSNSEIVQDGVTSILVPLDDVHATTEAVDNLLSNPEVASQMGIEAKADIALRWNWNTYVQDVTAVYERVIRS